jgi:hypothetical protein
MALGNLCKSFIINNLVACTTLVAFTATIVTPPPVYALDLNQIAFGVKIEKLYEKVKKAIDRGETNKLVGYMYDLKTEVEQQTGKKIDINKSIDQAEKEAKARGQKIDNRHLRAIKKEFGHHDKKHKHRAVYFAQCAELDIPYSSVEADYHFDVNYTMAKSAKGHDKDEKLEDVPITIMVGVTVTLCGIFLFVVPIPICQIAGGWLIGSGVSILSGDAIRRWDDYDQEQRKKDK